MPTLTAQGITKRYGATQALRGVGLSVEAGEIFGIIGPDGAGKTSLFRILATLIVPDAGSATVAGLDIVKNYKQIRNIVGYMPGKFSLYQDLTVEENLRFFASVFRTTIEENYDLIGDIYRQIEPFSGRRAGALSGGMKQKLALCCALIHKPSVLLLDEPTTGIDPVSRQDLWEMLRKLSGEGITTLVSTPYMDEATLCNRIALMKEGLFMDTDTPQGIVRKFGERLWAVSTGKMGRLLGDLRAWPGIGSCFAFGDRYHVTTVNTDPRQELHAYLSGKGHAEIVITEITPTIEDCYMKTAGS